MTREADHGDEYSNGRSLFVVSADGAGLTELAETWPDADDPEWSPSGDVITYCEHYSGRGGGPSGDIYTINVDGTGRTEIFAESSADRWPTWSPDGAQVAVAGRTMKQPYPRQSGVWLLDADGGNHRLLVRGGTTPAWRPGYSEPAVVEAVPTPADGPRLAFVAGSDRGHDLFTVRPDGSGLRQVTDLGGVSGPAWSPNHRRLAFAADGDVYVVRSDGTHLQRVVHRFYSNGDLAWSPDGRSIAWTVRRALGTVTLATGRLEYTKLPLSWAYDPEFSPDGQWIAVGEREEATKPERGIAVFRVHGRRHLAMLTHLPGSESQPSWSGNGRRLLFVREDGGTTVIMSMRTDGTALRRVVGTPALDALPVWAPNGGRFAYYSDGPAPFGSSPHPGIWAKGDGSAPGLSVLNRSVSDLDW
ncbi:TolB family protein [Nocardioides taihuensis]|uniref:Uncharacterized protein n=1 Tax=Nocardioides taihuensis TaxID=1835606 RepID=A0ABW0BEI1_9ACTN